MYPPCQVTLIILKMIFKLQADNDMLYQFEHCFSLHVIHFRLAIPITFHVNINMEETLTSVKKFHYIMMKNSFFLSDHISFT